MAADIRPIRSGGATVYKLTDQNMQTYLGFQWALGKVCEAPGTGPLCSRGWLHAYSHPDIAILLNPLHAAIWNPRLFRAHAEGVYLSDNSCKVGASRLMLVQELTVPIFTRVDYVAWSIFNVRAIPNRVPIPAWETWADEVLRTREVYKIKSTDASSSSAACAAPAAYNTATYNAACAAYNAAAAADYAADIYAAARAFAYAADYAARAAAYTYSLLRPLAEFHVWRRG